ncbi:MAG TPA: PmoA family protein [Puia sp.]
MLRNLLSTLLTLIALSTNAQTIATLEVALPRPTGGINVPVEVDLDKITLLPDSVLTLLQDGKPIPFQIDAGEHRALHWMADGRKAAYQLTRLKAGEKPATTNQMRATAENGNLIVSNGDQHLLQYVYKTVYPPEGIDTAYKRSGFIHPLWSPRGQVLTRIQAPDHYHHYGIWNPWTHVLYKGDTVDFWNLKDRKGTVRFARFASVESGPVFAQYETLHEHVAFQKGGGEEVAMNELQTVRVYHPDKDSYLFDLTIQLNCATANPVILLAYRYAGVGWRATEEWNKDNSEVLTSEGKTRTEADASKARWCIVQGAVGGDYAGAVMLSYPGNYNYPEPLRIWPINQNGRGDMYANFCPTKDIDWPLHPGHNYVLHYRWVVFNGHFTKDKAESAWSYFANPPTITIKR